MAFQIPTPQQIASATGGGFTGYSQPSGTFVKPRPTNTQSLVDNAIAQSGGPKGSFMGAAPTQPTQSTTVQAPPKISVDAPVNLAGFTPEQIRLFNAANQLGTGVKAIGVSELGQDTTVANVPPQPNFVPASTQGILEQIATDTPEQLGLKADKSGIVSSIEKLLAQQGTEGARRSELEIAGGIPELQSQLNEINKQITAIETDAFGAEMKAEDRLAPQFAISGEQAAIQRQKSVRIFGLAAASTALQGNLALAKDNVDRAIDAEFSPLEKRLDFQTLLLDLNRDDMTAAQQKKADALAVSIAKQKEDNAAARDEKNAIYDVMLTAAENGANNTTLNKILNSDSREAALSAATGAGIFIEPSGGTQGQIGISPITGKPFTEGQSQAAQFASRISNSETILSDGKGIHTPFVPDFLKSQDRRLFEQAENNFITAVLRRESGAAIAPEEYVTARLIYIPQATDGDEVLAQKLRARQIALTGMRNESVGAFDQLEGGLPQGGSLLGFNPESFFD